MFLKKFFKKDFSSHLEKAKRYQEAERWADSRHSLQDALNNLDRSQPDAAAAEAEISRLMSEAGNRMALANIDEAHYHRNAGVMEKAREHANLAIELADDVTIREKAENILNAISANSAPTKEHKHSAGCAGCATENTQQVETIDENDNNLTPQERFELLTRPLPGNLHDRYTELGEKFAGAFLCAHSGQEVEAGKILEELVSNNENDILLYELALLSHKEGNTVKCELLLQRSIAQNESNPLSNICLAELLVETGRFEDAVKHLQSMISKCISSEQAIMMLGDILHEVGEDNSSIETYALLLETPFKKEAAQRIIPILDRLGRTEEAQYLFKNFMKGCC